MTNPTLNRRGLLAGAMGAAGLMFGRAAFAQTAAVQVSKLGDGLSLIAGDGGNIAVAEGGDGLLLVDCGLPNMTAQLLEAAAGISPQRVKILFNTHYHFDHTGANEVLGKGGAQIVAHENVRTRLSSDQVLELLDRKFPASPSAAWPTVTFSNGGSLYHGKERLSYLRVAPAHTDGDSYVYFEKANVLHAGDLFFNGFYPVIDYSSGGWIGGMIAAADTLLKVGDSQTKIIPGHGAMAARADLKASRDMMAKVHERLMPWAKQKKTLEEVIAAAPTRDLDDKWGKGLMKPEMFVKAAYLGMLRNGK